jgi:UDP-N-acetylmuramate--alanine ligase
VKIHFIGIGGIGISALAQFCYQRGDEITGSEIQETNALSILRAKNISIKIPQQASNIPQDCDLVIYTEAILNKLSTVTNPEFLAAQQREIPMKSYFEYLGEISRNFRTIAIAGTHGKTTTTGLIASGFLNANFDVTIFVGSILKELNHSNFHAGSNLKVKNIDKYLLLEACEYRNNFKFIQPEIIILTNAELDHVDFYESEEHYIQTFQSLVEKAKIAIFHEEDKNVQKILQDFQGQKISLKNLELVDNNAKKSEIQAVINKISLSGIHNRQNAQLAVILGEILAQNPATNLNLKQYNQGIQQFTGAARRQEFLGDIKFQENLIKIYDDYGHHPTEITVTIQSFREKFPNSKLGLIFEPHQHSRTREFFSEFEHAFTLADFTGIFPIYAARDSQQDIDEINSENFVKNNQNLSLITDLNSVKSFLNKHLKNTKNTQDPIILLFMGAGKIDFFAHQFLKNNL